MEKFLNFSEIFLNLINLSEDDDTKIEEEIKPKNKNIIDSDLDTKKSTRLHPFIVKIIYENYNGKCTSTVKLRLRVWMKHCGTNLVGKCYCCCTDIESKNPAWHSGHILPAVKGGPKKLYNLQPICVKCNFDMGKQHMYQYMIYNDMPGCTYLPSTDPSVEKYKRMKDTYIECKSLLELYKSRSKSKTKSKTNEENRVKNIKCEKLPKMPKYLIEWWERDIKTDDENHIEVIKSYLISYSKR